jgi:tetratricopeptide (TPR) repeat protein
MRRLIRSGIMAIFFGILFNGATLIAQDLGSADVQFELEAYDLAIKAYETHLELNPTDEPAILKLATAYERQNDLIRSARWFEKLFVLNADRKDDEKIAFAKVLRSLGLIDQAREVLQSCKETEKAGLVSHHLDACDMAEYMLQQEEMYQLFLFYPSSDQADFSPSSWNDELVFASFHSDEMGNEQDDLRLFHNAANKLYRSPRSHKAQKADVKLMGTESFHKEGISSCNFSSNGKKVLYTLNNFKNANRQISGSEKGLSVYLADVDESGDFLNDYALPFNSTDHSVAFACFGEDENTIYFSANSKGDKDDFDLFQVEFDGLNWGQPVSLGEQINTEGNEITPFYNNGYLYFSSDLLPGMGGYDVFRANLENGSVEGIENMGKGSIPFPMICIWCKAKQVNTILVQTDLEEKEVMTSMWLFKTHSLSQILKLWP